MIPRKLRKRFLSAESTGFNENVRDSEESYKPDVSDLGSSRKPPYSNVKREILENPHVHTPHSDGNSPIHSLAAEAAALGLDYVGFTDHWDPLGISGGNYNEKCLGEPFEESYLMRRDTLEGFIEDHQDEGEIEELSVDLNIADGAELEYYLGHEDELEEAIERAGFDYLYLSVHKNKNGEDYRKMEPQNSKDAMQIIGSYFRDLREAYRFADKIDDIKVIAHPEGIERSTPLKEFFEHEEIYNAILNEEYKSIVEEAKKNNVISELNGRILLRNGETEWFNVLADSDINYAAGTDTHRVGAKDNYVWENETQARLNALETKLPELGRRPETVLEDVETSNVQLSRWVVERVKLDEDPRQNVK
jgi:HisJ family histidinol phosphate phosphatase